MHSQDGVSEAQQAVDREQAALAVSEAALKAHDGAVTDAERRLTLEVTLVTLQGRPGIDCIGENSIPGCQEAGNDV